MLKLNLIILAFLFCSVNCYNQETETWQTQDTIVIITDTIYSYDSIIIEEYIEENIYINENRISKNQIGFFYNGNIQSFRLKSIVEQNDIQLIQPIYAGQSSFGIEYGRRVNEKLKVTTGLFFTQLKQKYNFRGNSLKNFTYYDKRDTLDISYWDNPNTPGFDSIIYVASEIVNYEQIDSFPISNPYINEFKYLTTSFVVAYSLCNSDNLFLYVTGAGNISFLFESSSMKLYQKDENYISALNNNQFNKILFALCIGLGIEYYLIENLSLSVNGLISRQLRSIYKKETEIKSSSLGYNLKFGLTTYF